MDSKKTIVAGLVILLFAAIVYYFFFRENPKLPAKIDGVAAGSKTKDTAAKPTTVYVPTNVNVGAGVAKDELGFPVSMGQFSAGLKTLQLELMKYSQPLPIIRNSGGADGVLGNGTIAAIKTIYPSVAANITSKQAISRGDYDWMMKDLKDTSTNVPSTPPSPNTASAGGSTTNPSRAYLLSKGLTPSFNNVFNDIWASAHKNQNNFTYYGFDTAFLTNTYSWKTGKRIW